MKIVIPLVLKQTKAIKMKFFVHTKWCSCLDKCMFIKYEIWSYRQVSNISRTLVGNKIVDHSDVVEASPVGGAPTTSSFST